MFLIKENKPEMKTLDNTICYHELIMKIEDTGSCLHVDLPEGYYFEFYQDNKEDWIQIHLQSKEFTSVKEGEKIFSDFYGHFLKELPQRCLFLVEKTTKEKIGTATISRLKENQAGCDAVIDWFAIKKSHQGRHLSKALLARTIELAHELNHDQLLLHTQTTTPVAAKIYLDFGFKPLNKEDQIGWGILKSLINHEALAEFKSVENDKIYDLRNIEIEKQLAGLYQNHDFNYSVWTNNGMHQVYVYCEDNSYVYEIIEREGKIILKQIQET